MRTIGILLVLVALLAGCTAPAAPTADEPENDVVAAAPASDVFTIELKGNVIAGVLDLRNHDQPGEQVIFPFQKAGWNLQIDEVPQAIEVRVDWEGDGAFMLHPHWLKGDEGGRTKYYGYHSDQFTSGTGCIRLPDEDMATGVWPMMVHPAFQTVNTEFTITVGILGAEASVRPELHGHRADGAYDIDDHGVADCEFLNK